MLATEMHTVCGIDIQYKPIHTFLFITLFFKIHVALHVFEKKITHSAQSHIQNRRKFKKKKKLTNMPEEIFQNLVTF